MSSRSFGRPRASSSRRDPQPMPRARRCPRWGGASLWRRRLLPGLDRRARGRRRVFVAVCASGITRVRARNRASPKRGSKPPCRAAPMSMSADREAGSSTVTSTSAVNRAAPWTIAACAPKRYQSASSPSSAAARSRRRSATGEGMGGPLEEGLQADMRVEVGTPVVRCGIVWSTWPSRARAPERRPRSHGDLRSCTGSPSTIASTRRWRASRATRRPGVRRDP